MAISLKAGSSPGFEVDMIEEGSKKSKRIGRIGRFWRKRSSVLKNQIKTTTCVASWALHRRRLQLKNFFDFFGARWHCIFWRPIFKINQFIFDNFVFFCSIFDHNLLPWLKKYTYFSIVRGILLKRKFFARFWAPTLSFCPPRRNHSVNHFQLSNSLNYTTILLNFWLN